MHKASNVNRNLDFHTSPDVNYPFIAEARFVPEQKITQARWFLDRVTDDMQRAVIQSREQTMLGKLNAAKENFYAHRPELLLYGIPTRTNLFTEQLLGRGLDEGVSWFALYTILFALRAKMQTIDSAWADLGLIWLPKDGGMLLEYQGKYYTNKFDPAVDPSLIRPRTSRPNDGFSAYLKQVNKDVIIKEHHIQPENIEQVFHPLRERQIEWFSNIMLASEMQTRGDTGQAREYLLKAYEIYPSIKTADTLLYYTKETNYTEIIYYASEILERFGCTTGEEAWYAYRNRAIAYRELQDYENAEKDFLAFLKLAQDNGDEEAIRDTYEDLAGLACNMKDAEKVVQYVPARLNLGVDNPLHTMELRENLGLAYCVIGNFNFEQQNYIEAQKYFSLALNQLTSISQPDNAVIDDTATINSWLARIAAKQQDYQEALSWAQNGLTFNSNRASSFLRLHSALAYLVLGKTKEAEKAFVSARNLFQQNGDFDSDAEDDLQTAKEFLLKQDRQDDAAKVDNWLKWLKEH